MSNVEIHGYPAKKNFEAKVANLCRCIVESLKKEGFSDDDCSITVCNDETFNLGYYSRPFLRIYSTEHDDKVLAVLEKADLKIKIEVMPIKKIIPAKK